MTRLIVLAVAIYVAVVATLAGVLADPAQLFEPVPWYRAADFWVRPETSAERLHALAAAGRGSEGLLYTAVLGASAVLLSALASLGAGLGLASDTGRRLLPAREALLFLCVLLLVVLTADPLVALARDLEAQGVAPRAGIYAMPAYWIATIMLTCAMLGRYAALLAHDAAAWARAGWQRAGGTGWSSSRPSEA
ncbi:hypothetical protein [Blastochloris tepida]|uniref:Uncharacterized protein n=1 Tax=Blastochloris tepida TaxID=2233851 RepID=A0A348FWM5_9HYPH|nr:hypothetical protein [Blastochloris tepida]BBF91708.1 hypothetical protein BLTE_03930 [Blastochloris tepida]